MTEIIIQSILYFTLWCSIAFSIAGFYLVARISSVKNDENYAHWIYRCITGLSVVSVSAPYIGLFGTVWHIIEALSGIGNGNLNVAAIANPIGQALYATLWGLGAAIPAFISHRIISSIMVLKSNEEKEPSVREHIKMEGTAHKLGTTTEEGKIQAGYTLDLVPGDMHQSPIYPGRG